MQRFIMISAIRHSNELCGWCTNTKGDLAAGLAVVVLLEVKPFVPNIFSSVLRDTNKL
jgi:hypothetical protein